MSKTTRTSDRLKRLREGIRKKVRQMVEQEIEEMTATAGVSGFGTPYAFGPEGTVSSKKKKKKVNEGQRAGTITQSSNGKKWSAVNPKGTEKAVLRKREQAIEFSKTGMIGGDPNWDEHGEYTLPHNVNEGGDPYYAWRNDATMTPKQKIGGAIQEINRQLSEMEKVVRRSHRLKKEMGVPSSGLWNRTNKALMKIESRMHHISQGIRNMRG